MKHLKDCSCMDCDAERYKIIKNMNNPNSKKTVTKKVNQILNEIVKVCTKYRNQFTPNNCPINTDKLAHYSISETLVGSGGWHWVCPFCGEDFES